MQGSLPGLGPKMIMALLGGWQGMGIRRCAADGRSAVRSVAVDAVLPVRQKDPMKDRLPSTPSYAALLEEHHGADSDGPGAGGRRRQPATDLAVLGRFFRDRRRRVGGQRSSTNLLRTSFETSPR